MSSTILIFLSVLLIIHSSNHFSYSSHFHTISSHNKCSPLMSEKTAIRFQYRLIYGCINLLLHLKLIYIAIFAIRISNNSFLLKIFNHKFRNYIFCRYTFLKSHINHYHIFCIYISFNIQVTFCCHILCLKIAFPLNSILK